MELSFLSSINYIAVIVSSVVFFLIGSLWYSVLFGSVWAAEVKRHHVTIKTPTPNDMMTKMLLTFSANFIASFAMACLVILTNSTTVSTGFILGKIAAIGFAATAVGSVFIWESRSVKLFLIDVGYPVVGIIVSAILLSVWQ